MPLPLQVQLGRLVTSGLVFQQHCNLQETDCNITAVAKKIIIHAAHCAKKGMTHY